MTGAITAPLPSGFELWAGKMRSHLRDVPTTLEHIRHEALFPMRAGRLAERVGGSKDRQPIPIRLGSGDEDTDEARGPLEDADSLWAALVTYAQEVAEITGGRAPDALRGQWVHPRAGVAGFRSNADPLIARQQAREVVDWLLKRSDLVWDADALHLHESEEFLVGEVRRMRGKYGLGGVPLAVPLQWCSVCGEQRMSLSWFTGDAGQSVIRGRCRSCGHKEDR